MFGLMPRSLEEIVTFANEDEGFQELYDRLLAQSSTKQLITMSEEKTIVRRRQPRKMIRWIHALSKGKSKRKRQDRFFRQGKGLQRPKQHEVCRVLVKVGQKHVRKVTNMLLDGLGVMSMLMGCGKRQTGRQELVQNGGREQTTGHGNQKKQFGGFEINSTDRCCKTSESDGRRRCKDNISQVHFRGVNLCKEFPYRSESEYTKYRATSTRTCTMNSSMEKLTSTLNDSWTLWIEPQLSLFVFCSLSSLLLVSASLDCFSLFT